eukprot:CAMPEP_0115042184 /NCGR_PEP_ID=MMETSP0216-20121206/46122_1 /TAXON_ID=223996 /ORGANISM="Protocruzia adherens, Strain Boccale" /LENGTH=456 /DNA_ID=CAMNT_0002424265 /DNA_START=104 /DNA_END=1474 /DNA_ORIENTATION=-
MNCRIHYSDLNSETRRYKSQCYEKHQSRLKNMKSTIHRSGIRSDKALTSLVKNNKESIKEFQFYERGIEYRRQNKVLLDKLVDISEGKHMSVYPASMVSRHQPKSLNFHKRMEEARRIAEENESLAKRLILRAPVVRKKQQDQAFSDHLVYRMNLLKQVSPGSARSNKQFVFNSKQYLSRCSSAGTSMFSKTMQRNASATNMGTHKRYADGGTQGGVEEGEFDRENDHIRVRISTKISRQYIQTHKMKSPRQEEHHMRNTHSAFGRFGSATHTSRKKKSVRKSKKHLHQQQAASDGEVDTHDVGSHRSESKTLERPESEQKNTLSSNDVHESTTEKTEVGEKTTKIESNRASKKLEENSTREEEKASTNDKPDVEGSDAKNSSKEEIKKDGTATEKGANEETGEKKLEGDEGTKDVSREEIESTGEKSETRNVREKLESAVEESADLDKKEPEATQ